MGEGLTAMPLSAVTEGLMVVLAVLFTPEYEAVKVTRVVAFTVPTVIGKVADVDPCGMVTDGATLATCGFELDSATTAPPLPAGPVSATVPVCWPFVIWPETETLLSEGAGGAGGVIETLAVRFSPA
jgi:hypothetical protein